MAEETDKDDKTEAPSARRLEEARRQGDIVYSPEVTAWIMLAAGTLALMMLGPGMARGLGDSLVGLISNSSVISTSPDSLREIYLQAGIKIGAALGLFMLILIGAAIVARMVQDQPTFATAKLKPDLNKLNPIKGFSRVFGPPAFANFGKAAAKLVIVGSAAAWALWPHADSIAADAARDLTVFWPVVQERSLRLLGACLAAFSLIAVADYVFTRHAYMQKLKMSRHEMKEEFRQAEGDPLVRAKLRQVRGERARRRMLSKVPQASVVITNPTHYAIALQYEAGKTAAPICLAKGVDDIAFRIREAAETAGVPIVEDPPLARALFASADLDQAIPREHYEAVAKIIGYVMRLASRKRSTAARVNPNRPT
jgi:flagellar biosynthetic protein FlhB